MTPDRQLALVGAPSSAGAYAPGQEKAPAALREAGLVGRLSSVGIPCADWGDVEGFRWRPDLKSPRAMNVHHATAVARAVANRTALAFSSGLTPLVLGGDCTVELGTVAGALRGSDNVGLVYIDLDTDLNTPESTADGALDWMGVAHMLGVPGTVPELAGLAALTPMLRPDQLLFFGHDNVKPFERRIIDEMGIAEVRLDEVAADPTGSAHRVVDTWASRFDRLLIHLDVDVLDYTATPLAENTRRNVGLQLDTLMAALGPLLKVPNWAALTICEINPDHGAGDGSTLRTFTDTLARTLATVRRV